MSIFNQNEKVQVKSNSFDLTHDRKLSTKFGELTPVFVADTIPGDKFEISSNLMLRFAPMIAPVMHRVNAFVHFFFVPNRILWDGWEDFITGGEDGTDTTEWPYVRTFINPSSGTGIEVGSLGDHLGLPTNSDTSSVDVQREFSILPFAAYQKIWFDFYRDQNVTSYIEQDVLDGNNGAAFGTYWNITRRRAWQHDYFTSALPFLQRGPEAMIPIGAKADVLAKDATTIYTDGLEQVLRTQTGTTFTQNKVFGQRQGSNETGASSQDPNSGSVAIDTDAYLDLNASHYADIQNVQSSISDLRAAIALQQWLEANARGGARYIEQNYVHFGVTSSDARLQRPEFLGGMRVPVKISEVLQTTSSGAAVEAGESGTPQGNMAGHGIGIGNGKIAHYSEEHGYIMGILSIMPIPAYQQGIPRHFLRSDKYDYAWPEFQHIGEQGIYKAEIYQDGSTPEDGLEIWGYTPRYAEYKYLPSSVHGDFRTTLDFWHLGRKFSSFPNLNENFVTSGTDDLIRIFAVQDGTDYIWCHILHDTKATRKLAYFGNPKF